MNNPILADYLKQLYVFPLLSQEQEIELSKIIHDEERSPEERDEARETFINCNLRMVVNIAKRYQNFHLDIMDFIQAGNLGLCKAVDKFDPNLTNPTTGKPYRFSTFAYYWIKQAISKEIADNGRIIRNPVHIIQAITRYNAAVKKLTEKFCQIPTDVQIATELNCSLADIENYRRWSQDTSSLDAALGAQIGHENDESNSSLADFCVDDSQDPAATYRDIETTEIILQSFEDVLKPRSEIIMRLRYGYGAPTSSKTLTFLTSKNYPLDPADPSDWNHEYTLDEIGELVGLTRERIRQIIKEAEAALKAPLAARLGVNA